MLPGYPGREKRRPVSAIQKPTDDPGSPEALAARSVLSKVPEAILVLLDGVISFANPAA